MTAPKDKNPAKEPAPQGPPADGPFVAWLKSQRGGLTLAELNDAFADLAKKVDDLYETGQTGTLRLSVKMTPQSRTDWGMLVIADTIDIKEPTPKRAEALFYVDGDGRLSRHDPRQGSLDAQLAEVEDRRGGLHAVAPRDGKTDTEGDNQ